MSGQEAAISKSVGPDLSLAHFESGRLSGHLLILNFKHISGRCAKQNFELNSLQEHLVINSYIPLTISTAHRSMV